MKPHNKNNLDQSTRYRYLLDCVQQYAHGLQDSGETARSTLSQVSGEIIAFDAYNDEPPQNTAKNAFLWALLFGPLYFAYKGAWATAVVSFAAAFFTLGVSHLIFPFFAKKLVCK